ncbi:hypothetical protein, partial [Klebsiella pneumoniae]
PIYIIVLMNNIQKHLIFFGVNFKHEKATFSTPINRKHIKTVSKGRVKAITKPYMKGLVKEIRDIT